VQRGKYDTAMVGHQIEINKVNKGSRVSPPVGSVRKE